MQIELFDAYPFRPLESTLRPLLLGARRVDAAIAFVTHSGVAMFREYLKTRPAGSGRLVASVRFPTSLPDLANLEDSFPGTVFLHTGFRTPRETDSSVAQYSREDGVADNRLFARLEPPLVRTRRRILQDKTTVPITLDQTPAFATCWKRSSGSQRERQKNLAPR